MSIFSCCERLDETKYLHGPCGCPSASLNCESESITPSLCGYLEYIDDGGQTSTPPKKYLEKNYTSTITYGQIMHPKGCRENVMGASCAGTSYLRRSGGTTVYTQAHEYSADTCVASSVTNDPDPADLTTYSPPPCQDGYGNCGSVRSTSVDSTSDTTTTLTTITFISETVICLGLWHGPNNPMTNIMCYTNSTDSEWTLSVLDTDDDAVDRETPVEGTSCSSLWSTRSTGFSWTVRTSGYTIECDDLVIGVEYEVTPAIRKRTAVIGSFGAWEDVAVTPEVFTATSTTETIDNGGDPIELDHIQGFEYEITSVNIEKKA